MAILKRLKRVKPPKPLDPDEWVEVVAVEQVGRYGPGDTFKVRAGDLERLPVKAPAGVTYRVRDAHGAG